MSTIYVYCVHTAYMYPHESFFPMHFTHSLSPVCLLPHRLPYGGHRSELVSNTHTHYLAALDWVQFIDAIVCSSLRVCALPFACNVRTQINVNRNKCAKRTCATRAYSRALHIAAMAPLCVAVCGVYLSVYVCVCRVSVV